MCVQLEEQGHRLGDDLQAKKDSLRRIELEASAAASEAAQLQQSVDQLKEYVAAIGACSLPLCTSGFTPI